MASIKVFAVAIVTVAVSIVSSTDVLLSGPCNSYQAEIVNEGYYKSVHANSLRIKFIGVGFGLDRSDAKAKIESVGANYTLVCQGRQDLNDSQIKALFTMDMTVAVKCASHWLSNWNNLNISVQSAVADIAFGMGCSMLNQQTDMKNALEHLQYEKSVQALASTIWCDSNYNRCERDAHCIVKATM